MANAEEGPMMKVSDLKPKSRNVNMYVKVLEKGDTREIESRRDGSKHTLCESKAGDETGIVTMTLWDDDIGEVEEGKVYQIKNGYTNLFRGNIRLNIGRYGELEEAEEEIEEVDEENNVSEKFYEKRRKRGGYGGF